MAIENLRKIGDTLYERRDNGVLYPISKMASEAARREPDAGSLTGFPEIDRMLVSAGNVNQALNPVEAIGQSMGASRRMLAPETKGWDRVAALGDMLSGVGGVVAPLAAVGRLGKPAATALMESLTGGSPAAATDAKKFGEGWSDVYHWSRSPNDFTEFDPSKSTSSMSQLGPHVGTKEAANARYMGYTDSTGDPSPLGFTLPLKADLSKQFVNPSTGKPWSEIDLEMLVSALADEHGVDRRVVAPIIRDRLAREGYTSIPYVNDVEDAGNISHIMLTERPSSRDAVLRSRFAKFDPSMRNMKNLSAGVAAGAVGLEAAQYDPDQVDTIADTVRKREFATGGAVKYDPAAVDNIINQIREVNRG
jgi:hypothetical protein